MTRPSPVLRPALLRAYRRTAYAAGDVIARIGRRSAALDALLTRHGGRAGAFVSAWNPYSRPMPPGWNRRMGDALRRHVRRLPHVPGEGTARGWREEHLLVVTDPRRVAVLGRRFRQAALVVVRRGQAARLQPLAPQSDTDDKHPEGPPSAEGHHQAAHGPARGANDGPLLLARPSYQPASPLTCWSRFPPA